MQQQGVKFLQFERFENQPSLVDQFTNDPNNAKLQPILKAHRRDLAINIHKSHEESNLYLVMIRGKHDGKLCLFFCIVIIPHCCWCRNFDQTGTTIWISTWLSSIVVSRKTVSLLWVFAQI